MFFVPATILGTHAMAVSEADRVLPSWCFHDGNTVDFLIIFLKVVSGFVFCTIGGRLVLGGGREAKV